MFKNSRVILAIIFFILDAVLLLAYSQKFSVLFLFFILNILLFFIIKKDKPLVFLSFLIGVAVAVFFYDYWITYYGNSYFIGKKSDDWQYDILWTEGFIERYGINLFKISEHLNNLERNLGILHNSQGYVAIVVVFRWFGSFLDGYHTFLPRIFNIFILTLTAYYSSLIAFYYSKNKQIKTTTFIVVFFFPVMLFNSVHVFRDTLVSFILVIIYYLLLVNKKSIINILVVLFLLFVLYYNRTSTFFVMVLMILILYANPKKINLKLTLSLAFFAIISLFFLDGFISTLTRQLTTYGVLNTERFGNIGSKIFALPLYVGFIPRIIYLIFTPVPNFSGFHQLYQSIAAFTQILFFPYLFVAFKNKGIDIKLKIMFLVFFLGVAFSTATFRHVMMYLPFGIIITVLSYYKIKNKDIKLKNYLGYLILLFLLFIFSIFLALIY